MLLPNDQDIRTNLLKKPPVFSENINDYLQKAKWMSWLNTDLLRHTHSVPEKNKFPPSPPGSEGIPDYDRDKKGSGVGGNDIPLGQAIAQFATAIQTPASEHRLKENKTKMFASILSFTEPCQLKISQ